MIAAVIDTNILVSSVISDKGAPRKVFELWRDGRFTLVSSPELIEEVERVLRYPKIKRRYRLSESDILVFLHLLSIAAKIVPPEPLPLEGIPDPSDVKLFLAARAGRAGYLVTGDQALLAMGDFHGVKVVSAEAFVEIVEGLTLS